MKKQLRQQQERQLAALDTIVYFGFANMAVGGFRLELPPMTTMDFFDSTDESIDSSVRLLSSLRVEKAVQLIGWQHQQSIKIKQPYERYN